MKPFCGPKLALQILRWLTNDGSKRVFLRKEVPLGVSMIKGEVRGYTFRDITIWKFRKFGLKCLLGPQNHVFGEFWQLTLPFVIKTPKRHFLAQKHAFWAFIGRDRSYGVIWTQREEYRKRKNQK